MNHIITTLNAALQAMSSTALIEGKGFAVLPEAIGLIEFEAPVFIGVVAELPLETTVSDVLEAVRIGYGPLEATIKSVQAMATVGAGRGRKTCMDDALDHLSDFGTILLGCRQSRLNAAA